MKIVKDDISKPHILPFEERFPLKWYCIGVGSAAEGRVALQLEKYCEMLGWSHLFDCWMIPTEHVGVTRASGEKVIKKERLFAGYLLVHIRLTPDLRNLILSTSGVNAILGDRSGNVALPVSEKKVAQIIAMQIEAEGDGTKVRRVAKFRPGTEVVITYGNLENFTGVVLEHDGEHVVLNVNIFGRSTRSKFHETIVRPVSSLLLQVTE
jgi:transcription antitermination factor NusG